MKPNFTLCKKSATELLLKQDLRSSRINVQNLKYDKRIIFDSIQNYAEITKTPIENLIDPDTRILSDGCCLSAPSSNAFIVLYNDDIDSFYERLNWTLAHEIGHIYLGHKRDSDIEEIEAHFFAAQLLVPDYALYMIDKFYDLNHCDISKVFGVSLQAAKKRLNTYRSNSISINSADKDIWDMMEPHIKNYYFRKNASNSLKGFMMTPTFDI